MKKLFFSLSGLLLLVTISSLQVGVSSCTKEVTVHDTTRVIKKDTITIVKEVCPASTNGLWIGTYTADLLPNDPARYYSFIIKPNGAMIAESHPVGNTPYLATGTWTLNGNVLVCNIVYPNSPQGYSVSQTATAYYDSTNNKLTSGVWVNNGPPGGTGKFIMQKVK